MIIKRKLFSFINEDFSVVEEEREFGEVKRANKAAKREALLKRDSGGPVSKEEIKAMRNRIEGSEFRQQFLGKKGPVFSESKIRDMVRVANARQDVRGLDESLKIDSARGGKLNFDALRNNNKRSPEMKNRRLSILRLENFLKEEEKRDAERAATKAAEEAAQKKLNAEKAAAELRKKRVAKVEKLRSKKAFAKNAKIGAGIAAGTVAVGTGAYLAKKHYDKKKNEEKIQQ